MIARAQQTQIAVALYKIDVFDALQQGKTVTLFQDIGHDRQFEYFERARGFIRAGYTIVPLTPNAAKSIDEVR